jgi:hypothetical protein
MYACSPEILLGSSARHPPTLHPYRTVPPRPAPRWAYYYVELPTSQLGQPFVNGELLVTMRRRADAATGLGGDPLLFVKPFGARRPRGRAHVCGRLHEGPAARVSALRGGRPLSRTECAAGDPQADAPSPLSPTTVPHPAFPHSAPYYSPHPTPRRPTPHTSPPPHPTRPSPPPTKNQPSHPGPQAPRTATSRPLMRAPRTSRTGVTCAHSACSSQTTLCCSGSGGRQTPSIEDG